jgi:serine/threonine protein phosphatase PrpC
MVAAVTDVGPTRARNEDAVCLPGVLLGAAPRGRWNGLVECGPRAIVQVIDGMGGHGGGSIASVLSGLMVNEIIAQSGPIVAGSEPDESWVSGLLQRTGDTVVDVGALRPETQIMGAATAGLVLGSRSTLVFHVGDCRAYVLEDGYLSLLTADHRSRSGGGLTRSIGGTGRRETVATDFLSMDRAAARRYLLCTDGLTDTLDFDAIRESLSADSVTRAALQLVEAACAAGSSDNVTVIVVDVPAV